jgi:hypothetical protein
LETDIVKWLFAFFFVAAAGLSLARLAGYLVTIAVGAGAGLLAWRPRKPGERDERR